MKIQHSKQLGEAAFLSTFPAHTQQSAKEEKYFQKMNEADQQFYERQVRAVIETFSLIIAQSAYPHYYAPNTTTFDLIENMGVERTLITAIAQALLERHGHWTTKIDWEQLSDETKRRYLWQAEGALIAFFEWFRESFELPLDRRRLPLSHPDGAYHVPPPENLHELETVPLVLSRLDRHEPAFWHLLCVVDDLHCWEGIVTSEQQQCKGAYMRFEKRRYRVENQHE